MSTKIIDKRCGNCGSLVADPSQDPPQGCWEEVPDSEPEWVEVDDDMLENHRCDFWIPKETTDDADDMDQEGSTDHQNDDLGDGTHDRESGSGQTTGAADSDEADSAADEASEQTDESQVDTEQSAAAEGEAAANSEPVAVDDTGTAPSYDELLQEVLSLRKQAEQDGTYKKRLAEIRSQISDAKDSKSRWDKKIKVLQEEIGEVIEEMEKNIYDPAKYPLIEKTETKKPPTPPVVTPEPVVAETVDSKTVDSDAWKAVPAKEHFDFTDKEWELMAPSDGIADKMTVGDLEAFRVRLANGEKVKGFGEAKRQKLDDQMEEFWHKHPEFCFDNADEELDYGDDLDGDHSLDPSDVFGDEDDEEEFDEDDDSDDEDEDEDEEIDESDEDDDEF